MRSKRPMAELIADLKVFPQKIQNIRVREKVPFAQVPAIQGAIHSAERELDGKGRVVVRYSGTEALARVMVEAESEAKMQSITARHCRGNTRKRWACSGGGPRRRLQPKACLQRKIRLLMQPTVLIANENAIRPRWDSLNQQAQAADILRYVELHLGVITSLPGEAASSGMPRPSTPARKRALNCQSRVPLAEMAARDASLGRCGEIVVSSKRVRNVTT